MNGPLERIEALERRVADLEKRSGRLPTKWVSLQEAAEYCRLSARCLKKAIDAGALGHARIGKDLRLNLDCIEEWLNRNSLRPWADSDGRAS